MAAACAGWLREGVGDTSDERAVNASQAMQTGAPHALASRPGAKIRPRTEP